MPEQPTIVYENRRHKTLTEDDIQAIASLLQCNKCAFTHDQADALKNIASKDMTDTLGMIASNTNKATSLATKTIITGIVLGTLSLTWISLKHFAFEWIRGLVK
jgi:hypothetical protein